MYEQFAQAIQQKYPDIIVHGDNYPPPPTYALIAQFMSFAKIALIFFVVMNINPFTYINMGTPSIYSWALENKVRFQMLDSGFILCL